MLQPSDPSRTSQCLRGLQMSALDLLMIPANISNCHWILIVVDLRGKVIVTMHPMHEKINAYFLSCLDSWLITTFGGAWSKVYNPNWLPHQNDKSSCGIFVLYFSESIERVIRPNFHQNDIETIRARSILQI